MSFQDIILIEPYQFYLDLAFKGASNRASLLRSKSLTGSPLQIIRQISLIKIDIVQNSLSGRLLKILMSFPNIDELPFFYQELIKVSMDYGELKHALGAVSWANNKVKAFSRSYQVKIVRAQLSPSIQQLYKGYVGRVSSVLRQISSAFTTLKNARKALVEFPNIKTSLPTITIFGFPNVGKTTLLYNLTGSKPDIQPYAFTTKSINIAYLKKEDFKLQFLDTPGTLNRFNKMNNIEKQAYLALKYCTNLIVYVFDLTETYPLSDQLKLFGMIKDYKVPVIPYLAKSDLISEEQKNDFLKKFSMVTDIKELKKIILQKVASL